MSKAGGSVDVMNAVKSLFTHLPTSCFGESLEMGVLRIAEISTVASLGSAVGCVMLLASSSSGIAVLLIAMLLMIVQLVCSLLLFVGVCQRNPVFMKPWFWLTVIVWGLVFVLSTLTVLAAPFLHAASTLLIANFISIVVVCAVMRYCAQAVYALMKEVSETSTDIMSSHVDLESNKDVQEYDLSENLERDM